MALPANIALPFQCKALLALTEAEADGDDDDDDEIQVKLVYLLWANGSADIANAAGSRRSLSSTLCPLPSALCPLPFAFPAAFACCFLATMKQTTKATKEDFG